MWKKFLIVLLVATLTLGFAGMASAWWYEPEDAHTGCVNVTWNFPAYISICGSLDVEYTFQECEYGQYRIYTTASGTLKVSGPAWKLGVLVGALSGVGNWGPAGHSFMDAYEVRANGPGSLGWGDLPDQGGASCWPAWLAESVKCKEYTIDFGLTPCQIDFEAFAAEGNGTGGPVTFKTYFLVTIR